MTGETLRLLQLNLRKRSSGASPISPAAEEMCKIIDHEISLFRYDRDRLSNEVKELNARLFRLENNGSSA